MVVKGGAVDAGPAADLAYGHLLLALLGQQLHKSLLNGLPGILKPLISLGVHGALHYFYT